MYSGKASQKNKIRIILNETMKTKVIEVIWKSEWIITVNLVLETSIMSVISMYNPLVGHSDTDTMKKIHFDRACERYGKRN